MAMHCVNAKFTAHLCGLDMEQCGGCLCLAGAFLLLLQPQLHLSQLTLQALHFVHSCLC